MAVKRSLWDTILKVVIAVASAVLGIVGGDFEGQEGVFLKVKGARDRRVVVEIQGVIAVAMATIHPDLIEVIK